MAKVKFGILESTCVPLPLENVDTDQIIQGRDSEIIYSATGDTQKAERRTTILSLIIQNIEEKFLLRVKTLEVDRAESMLYGLYLTMVSGL
jgi:3-isopropylmalate dehydratase small subunit